MTIRASTWARAFSVLYGVGCLLLVYAVRHAAFPYAKALAALGVICIGFATIYMFGTADSWMYDPALPETYRRGRGG